MEYKLAIDLSNCNPPFLVHSDIFRTADLVRKQSGASRDLSQVLRAHLTNLENWFGVGDLIFPTFNYDFPKSKVFDVEKTDSQAGSLTNYVRFLGDYYRTTTPVYSFAINKIRPKTYSNTPFGKGSLFDDLYKKDGTIVFYGVGINCCTYLHYVESQFGPPRYRYDKLFRGTLSTKDTLAECEALFHVRPLDFKWGYNWGELERLLVSAGAIISLEKNVFAVKVRDLSKIWGDRIRANDLSILSDECRVDVENRLSSLGRRFVLTDFEQV